MVTAIAPVEWIDSPHSDVSLVRHAATHGAWLQERHRSGRLYRLPHRSRPA